MMLHLLTEERAAAVCLPMTLNLNRGRRRRAVCAAALQVHPVVLVHAEQAARDWWGRRDSDHVSYKPEKKAGFGARIASVQAGI